MGILKFDKILLALAKVLKTIQNPRYQLLIVMVLVVGVWGISSINGRNLIKIVQDFGFSWGDNNNFYQKLHPKNCNGTVWQLGGISLGSGTVKNQEVDCN